MIEILATGALNTVQDLGRFGFRNIGVTTCGAMDPIALKIGNLMLGNEEGAAALEIQTFPFKLRFENDGFIAITGADCAATLDGKTMPPWWALPVLAGQELELKTPTKAARAYLCFSGGIDVPQVMGSCSTSLRGAFGGYQGRFLAIGDRLAIGKANAPLIPASGFGVTPPEVALQDHFPPVENGVLPIRALPAGEQDLFGEDADRFWAQEWKISSQSDRTGYRLSGTPVKLNEHVEMRSHGVVTGVVQVPPAGEPIIQMSDANTAGGYPKIAGVIDIDLWRLGQARIGSRIRFVHSTLSEAKAAERAIAAYLTDIRQTMPLLSDALATMTKR